MGQIKTVLFDLGNVLAFIDFNEFWHSLGLLHQEEIAPFADGYNLWTRKYETGLVSTSEYLTRLQSVFGHRFNSEQLERAFMNIMREPVEGMKDIVKHVSRTHRTALVSNTNEIHYKISLEKYEALNVLHKHYLSYQIHAMKPAVDFYNAIIDHQKIDPSEMLLVDDLVINVEGAQAVGMQAIKFENLTQLKKDFNNSGIIL